MALLTLSVGLFSKVFSLTLWHWMIMRSADHLVIMLSGCQKVSWKEKLIITNKFSKEHFNQGLLSLIFFLGGGGRVGGGTGAT